MANRSFLHLVIGPTRERAIRGDSKGESVSLLTKNYSCLTLAMHHRGRLLLGASFGRTERRLSIAIVQSAPLFIGS